MVMMDWNYGSVKVFNNPLNRINMILWDMQYNEMYFSKSEEGRIYHE
jgi:hypothetical protein